MSVRNSPNRSPSGYNRAVGNDHFGYRPAPGGRVPSELYNRNQSHNDRQRLLDEIHLKRLKKQWLEENTQKGRERWTDFGNKELPIEQRRADIMKMIATNRISLLAGETGSGKSTQLAQYALEMGYDHIVYLQPRRVTTDGIAERIDEELTEQFAERGIEKPAHLVGMAHSERSTMKPDSVIQVMTSAVFSNRAQALQEEWKGKKVLIVADEVHEGNIETEFAIATAAESLTEQATWNMVLMSATMNEDEIQKAYTPINGKPIPSIEVQGRPHEIEYNEAPDKNVVEVFGSSYQDRNKTIIFTEGKRAMEAIEAELRKKFSDIRILKLHSKISDEERHEIFNAEVPGVHTVIISTSAGQSGITIPGVDLVISDGMTKSPELDAENAGGLPSRLCSQAEIIQQMGRGGRDIEGAKFFLANQVPYKKEKHGTKHEPLVTLSKRPMHAQADIYHTILTRNVLRAAAMNRDFYSLNEFLIHDVSYSTIQEAYLVLKMLGAVNSDNECTTTGALMNTLPLRPELSRALAEAMQRGTKQQQRQVAAIAAAIEAEGLGDGNANTIKLNHEKLPAWAQDDFFAELAYFDHMIKSETVTQAAERQGQAAQGRIEHKQIVRQDTHKPYAGAKLFYGASSGRVQELHDELALADTYANTFRITDKVEAKLFRQNTWDPTRFRLDSLNVKRAKKQYLKICQRIGIEPLDEAAPFLGDVSSGDIDELKEMLLTGMPHLIYEKIGERKHRGRMKKMPDGSKENRPPISYYRNVLAGPEKQESYEYDRTISNRSTLGRLALSATDTVIGYPRWYYDDDDVLHNVVERGFVMDRQRLRLTLGSTALSVRSHTIVGPDGRLRAVTESHVGSLQTSTNTEKDVADTRTKSDLLVEASLRRPGSAQRELREIKKVLDDLTGRIPASRRQYFFDRPTITQHSFEKLLNRAAHGAASTGHLDAQLRNIMGEDNIRLESYISHDQMSEIRTTMPATIAVGDSMYDVQYLDDEGATPYIANFSPESAGALPDRLTIPDGRVVLLRYSYDEGEDRYLSVSEVRAMRSGSVY